MFRSIVIIVCILQCCAVVADGVGAANVVGYVQSDHRHGIHVNTLRDVTGEEAKLGRIVNSPCEGAVLRFYDGTEWRRVVSELGTDDQLHWFDQDTGDCADDYRVPEGQSIQYDVPDEAEAGLSFMGSVPERFLEKGDMAPLFSDGPSLNEIRLKPDEVLRIWGYRPPTVTNKVVVTNNPASRFVVKMRDDTILHAKYNFAKMRIEDALTGHEIDANSDSVISFDVETNSEVAASSRLSRQQVSDLQMAYVREYKQAKDRREQDNAAKGVERALFSWKALWKWFLATAGAVVVGTIVSALCKQIWCLILWLFSRVRFMYYRWRGLRLYRKTMRMKRKHDSV